MRAFFMGGALLAGLVSFAVACSDDASGEQLCDPGSNVFCRCRGTREAGTKQCNDAGDGFGPCETSFGECEEIDDPTGGSGAGSSSGPGTGGGPPDPPEPGELFAACNEDPEQGEIKPCNEGLECSAMGFCTKSCEDYQDCTAAGDCVVFGTQQRCAPYCVQQSDCDSYSEGASCGYTDETVPPFDVVVCAQWGNELQLPPDGYPPQSDCDNDLYCNLGFEGVERVCDTDGCTDGCHSESDCAPGVMCSSDGSSLGMCGGGMMTENVDVCPGLTVALSASMAQQQLSGDTSDNAPPSETEGEDGVPEAGDFCTSLNPTEEDIYRVTIADAGELIVNVDGASTYDPIVYVRSGTCDAGTQIGCADDNGAGAGEILSLMVSANDTVWVVVDGFNGSTGSYTIDFDLTPN